MVGGLQPSKKPKDDDSDDRSESGTPVRANGDIPMVDLSNLRRQDSFSAGTPIGATYYGQNTPSSMANEEMDDGEKKKTKKFPFQVIPSKTSVIPHRRRKYAAAMRAFGKTYFPTVKLDYTLTEGKWYYEVDVTALKETHLSVGVVTSYFDAWGPTAQQEGVGGDANSWGYDPVNQDRRHGGQIAKRTFFSGEDTGERHRLGVCIDLDYEMAGIRGYRKFSWMIYDTRDDAHRTMVNIDGAEVTLEPSFDAGDGFSPAFSIEETVKVEVFTTGEDRGPAPDGFKWIGEYKNPDIQYDMSESGDVTVEIGGQVDSDNADDLQEEEGDIERRRRMKQERQDILNLATIRKINSVPLCICKPPGKRLRDMWWFWLIVNLTFVVFGPILLTIFAGFGALCLFPFCLMGLAASNGTYKAAALGCFLIILFGIQPVLSIAVVAVAGSYPNESAGNNPVEIYGPIVAYFAVAVTLALSWVVKVYLDNKDSEEDKDDDNKEDTHPLVKLFKFNDEVACPAAPNFRDFPADKLDQYVGLGAMSEFFVYIGRKNPNFGSGGLMGGFIGDETFKPWIVMEGNSNWEKDPARGKDMIQMDMVVRIQDDDQGLKYTDVRLVGAIDTKNNQFFGKWATSRADVVNNQGNFQFVLNDAKQQKRKMKEQEVKIRQEQLEFLVSKIVPQITNSADLTDQQEADGDDEVDEIELQTRIKRRKLRRRIKIAFVVIGFITAAIQMLIAPMYRVLNPSGDNPWFAGGPHIVNTFIIAVFMYSMLLLCLIVAYAMYLSITGYLNTFRRLTIFKTLTEDDRKRCRFLGPRDARTNEERLCNLTFRHSWQVVLWEKIRGNLHKNLENSTFRAIAGTVVLISIVVGGALSIILVIRLLVSKAPPDLLLFFCLYNVIVLAGFLVILMLLGAAISKHPQDATAMFQGQMASLLSDDTIPRKQRDETIRGMEVMIGGLSAVDPPTIFGFPLNEDLRNKVVGVAMTGVTTGVVKLLNIA